MATSPSPPPQDRAEPPSMPPPPPTHPVSSASRRLPPPCWSNDETVALIDSYRDKWYSLRRGNLKANHWQEVADAVAARSPVVASSSPKTSVQCRHKMEKLRKRYRAELQRFQSAAPNRHRMPSSSSWVHFHLMHSMEKGPVAVAVDSGSHGPNEEEDNEDEDDDDDDNDDLYANGVKHHGLPYNRRVNSVMSNGIGSSSSGRSAFRIKFPGGPSSMAPPGTGFRQRNHENPNPNPNFGFGVNRDFSGAGKKRGEREGDAVAEMVEAVKVLGDGFVRMEKMKMEMARDIEAMRMEMEMKRTEMILESQQRIVEAFAKGLAEKKKKAKRLPSPEP